jgi:glycosyltransferase involved in cell wall biosynthesis
MRILYVTGHYPPDFVSGATLQVQRLAREVSRLGHEVRVVAGAIHGGLADGQWRDDVVDGIPVRWIGTADRIDQDVDANWRNDHATAVVTSIVEEWEPDVVHAHALQTLGADLLTAAGTHGVTSVVTMHDLWWWCPRLFLVDRDLRPCPLDTRTSDCACARDRDWRLERAGALATVLDAVDAVLVPSSALRGVVVANGLDPGRVDVDENDVDVPATAAPVAPRAPGGPVRFVYVGGDSPLKGRDVLVAAADHLRSTRGWALTAYGVQRPRRRLASWARSWKHVAFVPPYEPTSTARIMAQADVVIIPSLARESYSIAAREALAAGAAVITSDCLGPEEVVEHGRNGLVVATGDVAALADAMRSLVADRELLHRLQDGAAADPPRLRQPAEHAASLVERYRAVVAAPADDR